MDNEVEASGNSDSDSVEIDLEVTKESPIAAIVEPIMSAEVTNSATATASVGQSSIKKRSNASSCWDHFKKNPNGKSALCIYCKKSIITNGGSTGGLKKHINACKNNPSNRNVKQQRTVELVRMAGSNLAQLSVRDYTMKGYRQHLVDFVVMDEHPFRAVEGKGFQRLMRYMNPSWEPLSRITVAKDVLKKYSEEKLKLRRKLAGHRVSLTSDCWTSIQNLGYMVVTAHWIDHSWDIQKRIIGFFQIGDHKGDTIASELLSCISDWGIKKVGSITLDNASANDVAVGKVKKKLLAKQGNCLKLKGEMFHMRCICHIVNLIVGDGMKIMTPYIDSIRKAVRYVRSSPARFKKFKECVVEEEISTKALLTLDVPTRWNSTYLMLDSAIKYRKVFDRMNEDLNYVEYFDKSACRDEYTWDHAQMFIEFLETFYDLTLRLSGTSYATTNLCFRDICAVKNQLNVLKIKPTGSSLERMGQSMDLKFGKYWGDPEKVNVVVFFATLLDPRYKLIYIEHCLKAVFGEDVQKRVVEMITSKVYELFNEYAQGSGSKESTGSGSVALPQIEETRNKIVDELDSSFLQAVSSTEETNLHEIDRYLRDKQGGMDIKSPSFNVLLWWKLNSHSYPTLSKIAKDLLAVPVSTVASESAFSGGGRLLDPFRSSLTPTTVEALILLRNWLHENNELSVVGDQMDELNSYRDSLRLEEPEETDEPEPDGSSTNENNKINAKMIKDKGKAKIAY